MQLALHLQLPDSVFLPQRHARHCLSSCFLRLRHGPPAAAPPAAPFDQFHFLRQQRGSRRTTKSGHKLELWLIQSIILGEVLLLRHVQYRNQSPTARTSFPTVSRSRRSTLEASSSALGKPIFSPTAWCWTRCSVHFSNVTCPKLLHALRALRCFFSPLSHLCDASFLSPSDK